jgi:hypothetical protein
MKRHEKEPVFLTAVRLGSAEAPRTAHTSPVAPRKSGPAGSAGRFNAARFFLSGRGTVGRLVAALLTILLVSPCSAFEKSIHESFSNDAVDLYQACTGRVMPRQLSDAFVAGSVEEDTWGWTRARNWHYFNRDHKIGRYWKFILCNGSNEHIFNERLRRLEYLFLSEAPGRDVYEVAGRLAHHIQDMSAPAHVVPINHLLCDNVDHYRYRPALPDRISSCEGALRPVVSPPDLLVQAADGTLKAIREPVVFDSGKKIENETWLKFWGGPEDRELSGFGTYGEYGNAFGVSPPCRNGRVCGEYNRDVYDRFYADRYRSAVLDTVRLLNYLERRMTRSGVKMESK